MPNMKEVWTVADRGPNRKGFWVRLGTAFENKDGSWNIVLDALPLSGKLIMRDERPRDEVQAPSTSTRGQVPDQPPAPSDGPPADDDIPF